MTDITTTGLELSALDSIDYARPHREETRDLLCKLSPSEYRERGDDFAKAVRHREQLELELAQEVKRRKGLVEAAAGDERRLLKVIETGAEERPTKIKEMWAKRSGEDVLVAVRLDKFTGFVDATCFVGSRYPQPMDRQAVLPKANRKMNGSMHGSVSEDVLQRQADAAFAAEDHTDSSDTTADDDDRSMIDFDGAAPPEAEVAPKAKAKAPKAKAKSRK